MEGPVRLTGPSRMRVRGRKPGPLPGVVLRVLAHLSRVDRLLRFVYRSHMNRASSCRITRIRLFFEADTLSFEQLIETVAFHR